MRKMLPLLLLALCACSSTHVYRTFEMRSFSDDPRADGITDFHGPRELAGTEERIGALTAYADFASRFWEGISPHRPVVTEEETASELSSIKPQPLTSVRKTIPLDGWKATGYRPGVEKHQREDFFSFIPDTLEWRWRMKGRYSGGPLDVLLQGGKPLTVQCGNDSEFELYCDFTSRTLFLSSNGNTKQEIPLDEDFGSMVTGFSLSGDATLENFSLYEFTPQEDNEETPYRLVLHYDEDFREPPMIAGWEQPDYDDSKWLDAHLPFAHGAIAHKGEALYLRKSVEVGGFERAYLDIETLDPSGEIWINGKMAARVTGRIPRHLDIGAFLEENAVNTIAVKVNPNYSERPMKHSPSDRNIGHFLGRTKLILTGSPAPINEVFAYTSVFSEGRVLQHHVISLDGSEPFSGRVTISYSPWFPYEKGPVASVTKDISVSPGEDAEIDLPIDKPLLWSPGKPQLYKVSAVIEDKDGNKVDDYVFTTGIRFIEQKEGVLYVNGRPEMLRGAQVFGFRLPVETMAKTIRCATDAQVMKEIVMSKKLGNLLRLHVHTELNIADGINDPRYAEYADQKGLYIIWQTAAWLREGEASGVDVKNYPLYMHLVRNHPSIVMWEAANHPNRFRQHGPEETVNYFSSIISAIESADTSRLISPTSYWPLSHYGNYDGTLDYRGNPMEPNPLLLHRKLTRGSQDAYTGYGHNWSSLRHYPSGWAKSCLEAKDLCYFNFEHEESAAQPDWDLARKEPWYKVRSYEKPYEEGSIGRVLDFSEWRESQAFQAFSAWESMKVQTLSGVSGFSWCSLESGPNMVTYEKPLVDAFDNPKMAFCANKMAFQDKWAASDNVDTVYGPADEIVPVIFSLDGAATLRLEISLQDRDGKEIEKKVFRHVSVPDGRSVTRLEPFRFDSSPEGPHFIVYTLSEE